LCIYSLFRQKPESPAEIILTMEDYEQEFQYSPLRGRSPPSPSHSFPSPTAPLSDASAVGETNTVDTSNSEDSVSDSSESNFEGFNVVVPYQCDPSFKNREDLEHFLKGCDNRVENSDSEDENVDLEGWKDIKKECSCGLCGDINSNGFEHLCCQQIEKWKKNAPVEEQKSCLTKATGFIMATNKFAVSNMCFQLMRRRGRKLSGNQGLENNQMRFGYYRSAHLFIGD